MSERLVTREAVVTGDKTGNASALQEHAASHQTPSPEAITLFRNLLTENIEGFRQSADKNRRRALIAKIITASLAAATTLLLGLKSNPIFTEHENAFSSAALVFSAFVPVLVAWDSFFDHRWLWVRFTAAVTSLFKISDDLNYSEAKKELSQKVLGSGLTI
jgi:hypothetical protein